jgi:hypothetical protein
MTDIEIVSQIGEELNCNVRVKAHDEERTPLGKGITARCDEGGSVIELHFLGYGITYLPELVAKLSKIEYLTFHKTKVSVLPEWIKELTELDCLNFSDTPIPEVPEWLEAMPKLEQVVARGIGLKYCGDFGYRIDDNNEAIIMRYIGEDEDVTVPAVVDGFPVRGIKDFSPRAFMECTSLRSVTFSEGIKEIMLPFWDCGLLETINLPASATKVRCVIGLCPSLKRLIVHEDNPNYTDVDGVLYSKDKTKLVFVPEGHAIASMEHYDIPEGVTEVEIGTLKNCVFRSATIPKSMTEIGYCTFRGCRHLESVTLHDGVTEIGSGAFENCESLSGIHIPASVTEIWLSLGAFDGCWGLKSITVDENNPVYASYDGRLYDKGKTALLYSPLGLEGGEYPDSMTKIGRCAYRGNEDLRGLDIPARVTEIDGWAFSNCYSLERINVADDNPVYCSVDGILFSKDKTKLVFYPHGKPTEYTVPDGVTEICDEAFAFFGLRKINLPDGLTTIGIRAFWECPLEDIALPDSVTEISQDAFMFCEEFSDEALRKVQKINPAAWTRPRPENVISVQI